jgi:hypothetical protein
VSGATCPAHASEPILGSCERCGDFVCRLDSERWEGRLHCRACARRFSAEWLEAFRRELWGKRDGFAYLYGVLGTGANLLTATFSGRHGFAGANAFGPVLVLSLAAAVIDVAYFFRARWARIAVMLLPLATAALPGGRGNPLPFALVSVAIGLAAYFDTRNRLFFRIDVDEPKLRALHDLLRNNPLARRGLVLAVGGLFFPPFAVAALPASIVGLLRVDPAARPPVGRRGQAIAGIAISSIALLGWTILLVASRW